VHIPAELPVTVELGLRVAAGALASLQVDDGRAAECAAALDKATRPFEVRLTHLALERACEQAIISSRSRQRLNSSLNAAFGRNKERLPAERPPNVDTLGLARGDSGFSDLLLEAMRERGSLTPQRLAQLVASVRELKSEEALKSAYDAVCKVFSTSLLSKADRPKLAAAFVQAQGRLRANVIAVSVSMRPQGVAAFAPPAGEKPLQPYDRAMIEQHLKGATSEDLASMRKLIAAVITSPLFRAQDSKSLLGTLDQRTMFLRMV
jgi:hypothetical protein